MCVCVGVYLWVCVCVVCVGVCVWCVCVCVCVYGCVSVCPGLRTVRALRCSTVRYAALCSDEDVAENPVTLTSSVIKFITFRHSIHHSRWPCIV